MFLGQEQFELKKLIIKYMVIRAKLGLLCLMALLMNWLEFKKLTNQEFADLYFDIDFVMNYLYASSTSYCKQ